jgi:hypothetical protein
MDTHQATNILLNSTRMFEHMRLHSRGILDDNFQFQWSMHASIVLAFVGSQFSEN